LATRSNGDAGIVCRALSRREGVISAPGLRDKVSRDNFSATTFTNRSEGTTDRTSGQFMGFMKLRITQLLRSQEMSNLTALSAGSASSACFRGLEFREANLLLGQNRMAFLARHSPIQNSQHTFFLQPPYCRGTSSDQFRSIQIASDRLSGRSLHSSTTLRSIPHDAAFVRNKRCRTAFGIAPSRVSKADGSRLPRVEIAEAGRRMEARATNHEEK